VPTRKQRRRAQKDRRHDYEYETVWVDPETGEEVEPPEDAVVDPPAKRANGSAKPTTNAKAKARPQQDGRQIRVPPAPSWSRAAKRSVMIGVALFAVIYLLGTKNGHHSPASALLLAVIYTAIFIPAQYSIDRFAHNRWQRRADQEAAKRSARKR
jgi:hypothetical protein